MTRLAGKSRGFTMLEILIVMAILVLVAFFGAPAMVQMQKRAMVEGTATSMVQILNQARIEAVQRGVPVVIEFQVPATADEQHVLFAFADVDDDASPLTYSPVPGQPVRESDYAVVDYGLQHHGKPGGTLRRPESNLYFWAVVDDNPGDAAGNWVRGFTTRPADNETVIVFEPDGSIRDPGALRLGMGPFPRTSGNPETDYERNFFEITIGPRASARVQLLKWVATGSAATSAYVTKASDAQGVNWHWY